jgi:CheY-like chemotaxis protein
MKSSAAAVETKTPLLLMVDDNKMGLTARKAVFEEIQFRVTAVATPEEALEQAVAAEFDVIVTDFKMTTMTGVDLIHKLRQGGVRAPVVLLSGYVEALGLNEANTGADVVIQKSASELNHLVRAVKALLRRRKPPTPEPGPDRRKRA